MLLSRATFPVVSDNLSTFDVTGNIAGDDIVTTGYTENFPWKHRNLCPKLCLESSVAPYSADNHSKILYFVSLFIILHIKPELLRTSDWYQHISFWRATVDCYRLPPRKPSCKCLDLSTECATHSGCSDV